MRGRILLTYLRVWIDSMIQPTSYLKDGNVEEKLGLGTRREQPTHGPRLDSPDWEVFGYPKAVIIAFC
jgi:hypothetical protein